MNSSWTAQQAAKRYAEDEAFAKEFDRCLQELYLDQLTRLERIAKKLGHAQKAKLKREAPEVLLTPERLISILSDADGFLTRGQIALRLGVNSRDATLTRVLRYAKAQGMLRQEGDRRSARYSLLGRRRR